MYVACGQRCGVRPTRCFQLAPSRPHCRHRWRSLVFCERHVRGDVVRSCRLLVRLWDSSLLVQGPQAPQRDSRLLGPHVSFSLFDRYLWRLIHVLRSSIFRAIDTDL